MSIVAKDLNMLQKDFELHNSLASIPCYLYGHSSKCIVLICIALIVHVPFWFLPVTIEYKMTRAIWEMGLYVHCAAEGACSGVL